MFSNGEKEGNNRFLIIGLGNPGRKYKNNRHNVGFMVINQLSARIDIKVTRVQQKALFGDGRLNDHRLYLAKPQTFMNRSGESVAALVRYFRIVPSNILVVYDEIDLPLATLRLRERGGSGGHNGMKSIIDHIGQDFPRLRIGVGRPPGIMDPAAYVLRDFDATEKAIVKETIAQAVSAVEAFVLFGLEVAMTHYNGPIEGVS